MITDVAKAQINNKLTYPSVETDGNYVPTYLTRLLLIAVHFSEQISEI